MPIRYTHRASTVAALPQFLDNRFGHGKSLLFLETEPQAANLLARLQERERDREFELIASGFEIHRL